MSKQLFENHRESETHRNEAQADRNEHERGVLGWHKGGESALPKRGDKIERRKTPPRKPKVARTSVHFR